MAYGLPCVATRVGAVPEIVDDGVSGFIVAKGDSDAMAKRLEQLLADAGLRERMGAGARDRMLQAFTKPVHLSALNAILDV